MTGKTLARPRDHQAGEERAGTHDSALFSRASQSRKYGDQAAEDAGHTEPGERLAQHPGKQVCAHVPGLHGDQHQQYQHDFPENFCEAFAAVMDGAVGFQHQGDCAVGRQRDQGEYRDRNRVPIEDADVDRARRNS